MNLSKESQKIFSFRWALIAPILIIFAGLCVYSNSFFAPFLFDDWSNIVFNPHIRHLWPFWDALSRPFWFGQTDVYVALQRRPTTSLTFALNYASGGLNVWGYHAVNLAVHILAALVLFGIVRRTLLTSNFKARFGHVALKLALIVSLIWMVHPIQTESVTYIIQRCESLMGLFFLTTLYCFIRTTENPKHAGMWSVLAVVSCAFGMASKEVMVIAPVIVLLYHRVFIENSFRGIYQKHRWFYISLAMTWIIFAALIYQRLPLQGSDVLYSDSSEPHLEYFLNQPAVILHYLKLTFWPASLCFYYGWPFVPYGLTMNLSATVIIILITVVIWAIRYRPALGFLGAWVFLILAPTSSIRPLNLIAAEHRMYLPLAALVCFVVIIGHESLNYLKSRFGQMRYLISTVGFIMPVFVVLILGGSTLKRNEVYQNTLSLWRDTVSKQPNNDKLRYQLGSALFEEGYLEEATEQYSLALDMRADEDDPLTSMKRNNIAVALMQLGRSEEALAHLTEAEKVNPESEVVKENLEKALTINKVKFTKL